MFELLSDAADDDGASRPTVPEAVAAAYADVLAPYHKWPMRATFNLVANGAPGWGELVERFSPPKTRSGRPEKRPSWRRHVWRPRSASAGCIGRPAAALRPLP